MSINLTKKRDIKSIGIIGGGQLGLMMMEAAHKLSFSVNVLDPGADCPCSKKADNFICAKYDDENALEKLCSISDTVTYEFENVPYNVVDKLQKKYNIPQGHIPLYISQHRIREKQSAKKSGLNVGEFSAIEKGQDITEAVEKIGYPCVLKTCMFGYDGKGQAVIRNKEDIKDANEIAETSECILESFINFECEASVIAVRNKNDEIVFMPIARNIHKNNILHKSIVPSGLDETLQNDMRAQTQRFMEHMDIYGILAVEFFVCKDKVFFNEMAPRPHNSGHYSMDGCDASQFEQIVRMVTDLPFCDSSLKRPTVMVNILGQHVDVAMNYKSDNAYLHMYGKTESKHNRKMGHINFFGDDIKSVIADSDKFLTLFED